MVDGYTELVVTALLTDGQMEQLQEIARLRNETVQDAARSALHMGIVTNWMDAKDFRKTSEYQRLQEEINRRENK